MKEKRSRLSSEDGVSPVVGVMLMLVVTIIIAAVVSAFSGGMIGDQNKVPKATIRATFSISDGMKIIHTGGDPLPIHTTVFTIWDGPTFGPNVETISRQVVNKSLIQDSDGTYILGDGGMLQKTSFKAGDVLLIGSEDIYPDRLQPNVMPTDYSHDDGLEYEGEQTNRWALVLRNTDNLGNEFVISLSDSSGNLIAKTDVTVTS